MKCITNKIHLNIILLIFVLGCSRESGNQTSAENSSNNPVHIEKKVEILPLTNMVFIKAGSFVRLKHTITVSKDFWLGKYEVTQAEYVALMGKNPSHFMEDTNAPVEKLSYNDAAAYCEALTKREREVGRLSLNYEYRLPTEAEWEYACRAGTTNFFSFGNSETNAGEYAWTWENSEEHTHPVGQKKPNPWGLYDMHGNVWEWCQDWFAPYPTNNLVDPVGPREGKVKVFRGGGWNNEAKFARSSNRFMMAPASGIYFVGFRVALCKKQ